jgi:hypothetical protein
MIYSNIFHIFPYDITILIGKSSNYMGHGRLALQFANRLPSMASSMLLPAGLVAVFLKAIHISVG